MPTAVCSPAASVAVAVPGVAVFVPHGPTFPAPHARTNAHQRCRGHFYVRDRPPRTLPSPPLPPSARLPLFPPATVVPALGAGVVRMPWAVAPGSSRAITAITAITICTMATVPQQRPEAKAPIHGCGGHSGIPYHFSLLSVGRLGCIGRQ